MTDTPPPSGAWLELATLVEPEAVEPVSAAFAEWGQGVAIEQPVISSPDGEVVVYPEDQPMIVKTYLPLQDPRTPERRAQLEKAVWALGRLRQVGALQVRTLREEDWANAWKAYFFVHRVGDRTVIVPSWRSDEYQARQGDVLLLLDPGMAFGTGLHPTTRLCLRALEALHLPGWRVLDLGAGSGILSIAAARQGAARVDAVEIESVAAAVCQENVRTNGVDATVSVHAGTLADLALPAASYDLVLANISLRVILEVQERLLALLRPGGLAIFSGVLDERRDDLRAALEASGWEVGHVDQEQDWIALQARRGDASGGA